MNIDGDGTPTADLLQLGSGDTSSTDGVDALQITFATSNASGNLIDLTPTFSDTSDDNSGETWNVIDIDNFTATYSEASYNPTSTLNGLNIGTLTEAGTDTITSTALNISTGWDTDINATTSLEIGIGGTNEITLTDTSLSPVTNNGDMTITHSTDTLTVAGGSFVAPSLTATSSGITVSGTSDFESYASIGNGSALDADYTLIVDRDFTANASNYAAVISIPAQTITEATSGTHARISALDITAPTITNGTAVVTDAATVYISDAPSATGANNYALWVDSGAVQIDGNLTVGGTVSLLGDVDISLPDGSTMNIDGDGTPTADLLQLGSGDTSSTDGVDALQITFATSNASGNLIDLTPTFSDTLNDAVGETWNVIDIDNFTATYSEPSYTPTSTLNGLNIGTLTEAGTDTITSTALNISTGWDTDINATTSLEIGIGGTNEITLTDTSLSPVTDNGNALGTTSLKWADLFLASGGVVDFNNGDMTITHSTDTLTVAGGSFVAPSLTATSSGITVSGTSDFESYASIGNGSALDADYTLIVDRDFTANAS